MALFCILTLQDPPFYFRIITSYLKMSGSRCVILLKQYNLFTDSPPRGPPLMNLTPCTPESLPSKSVRGTKRKIVVESPKVCTYHLLLENEWNVLLNPNQISILSKRNLFPSHNNWNIDTEQQWFTQLHAVQTLKCVRPGCLVGPKYFVFVLGLLNVCFRGSIRGSKYFVVC
jgi:hypothetical protein